MSTSKYVYAAVGVGRGIDGQPTRFDLENGVLVHKSRYLGCKALRSEPYRTRLESLVSVGVAAWSRMVAHQNEDHFSTLIYYTIGFKLP